MSRSRDEWLARQDAARHLLPNPVISSVRAERLPHGWQVTVRGASLMPLGSPGRVTVGGQALEQVTFKSNEIRGWLPLLPTRRDVLVDLAAAGAIQGSLEADPLP